MRALPSMAVYSPADHVTAAALFDVCWENTKPKYLRFDAQVLPVLYASAPPDVARGFHVHRTGSDVCLIATGYMVHTALAVAERLAAQGVSVGVMDLFDIAGFSETSFGSALSRYERIVTMEEGFRGRGGLDAMLFDWMTRSGKNARMLNIGVEAAYRFELGSRTELHEQVGIGVHVATEKVLSFLTTVAA